MTTEKLLVRADHLTRDLLSDSFNVHLTDRLVQGWARAMRVAAACWDAIPTGLSQQATDITGGPFTQAALTAAQITADATHWAGSRPDPRTAQVSVLLAKAGKALGGQFPKTVTSDPDEFARAAELRTGLLHVGWVLTHAAATSTSRHAAYLAETDPGLSVQVAAVSTRIRGIEQTLDAHLHQRTGPPAEIRALDQTLNRVLQAAYTAQPANATTNLVLADIGRDITVNTARLAIRAATNGAIRAADVRHRMLPALENAMRQWEGSRRAWARMLSPYDRPAPGIAAIGARLQRQWREPGIAAHPAITTSMTGALIVAAELAVRNHRALTNPDPAGPASAVAKLAGELLDQEPRGFGRMQTWLSMDNIEGPTPTRLPEIVQAELDRQGRATLDTSLAARSAGNALIDRRSYQPQLSLYQGQTAPGRRPPEQPSPRAAAPASPRIG